MGRRQATILSVFLLFVALSSILFQNCAGYSALPMNSKAAVTGGTDVVVPTALEQVHTGDFFPALNPPDAPTNTAANVTGRAVVLRFNDHTEIDIWATGLTPNSTYETHVHALPCNISAGGHYKINPAITTTEASNEVWPTITTDATGVGKAHLNTKHLLRADGVSIVIHDLSNVTTTKLMCADLSPEGMATANNGRFTNLPTAPATVNSAGAAVISRLGIGRTQVRFAVRGLTVNTNYTAIISDGACVAPSNGGAHYKMNANITTIDPNNEIRVNFTTSATGTASGAAMFGHLVRPNGVSMVIEDTSATPIKIACADLNVAGGLLSTQVAIDKATPAIITGSAKLQRTLDGQTVMTVSAAGLQPNRLYMMHLHALPCNLNAGGGHYLIDITVPPPAVQANELWVQFTTDATGAGSGTSSMKHLARADAYSVVIHDPDVAADRIACTQLR